MTKYQQFLNEIEVISEDLFNEIIDSLPEVDIDLIDFDLYDPGSMDEIAQTIINYILGDWPNVYVDNIDFENKTFELDDINSLEDLEEIKKHFSKWTISNYEDIVEAIKQENKEENLLDSLIGIIRNRASIEQLQNFVDSL